jgi:hypothetical protein
MTSASNPGQAGGPRRWGRAQDPQVADSYRQTRKPREPTVCPRCGAVYKAGRWQWGERPAAAHEEMCPACRRINDDFPAGVLTLTGGFLARHQDEIMNLARNQEAFEKSQHPLNRIMKVESAEDRVVITTTDIHLPRRIAEALESAFDGALQFHYDEDGYFVRIDWHRDV